MYFGEVGFAGFGAMEEVAGATIDSSDDEDGDAEGIGQDDGDEAGRGESGAGAQPKRRRRGE